MMRRVISLSAISLIVVALFVLARGSLAQPGTPVAAIPAQQPPNNPIDTGVWNINAPGSWAATGDINGVAGQNGIEITASNVVIDLKGYTVTGVAGALDGIAVIGNLFNITIVNGTIRNWPGHGIGLNSASPGPNTAVGVTLRDLTISGNTLNGAWIKQGRIVNCVARANGSNGFEVAQTSSLSGVEAESNGLQGISLGYGCSIDNSSAGNNVKNGILGLGHGNTITECACTNNTLNGINCLNVGSTVVACNARSNGQDGIAVGAGSTLQACASSGNTRDGFASGAAASSQGVVFSNCNASNNGGYGMNLTAGAAVVSDSFVGSNTLGGVYTGTLNGWCTISRCNVVLNLGVGIFVGGTSRIEGNTVSQNTGTGIHIGGGSCSILDNHVYHNGTTVGTHYGIYVAGPSCLIEHNNVTDHTVGAITISSSGNTAYKNILHNNIGGNISWSGTNDVAPYGTAATGTNPWANILY